MSYVVDFLTIYSNDYNAFKMSQHDFCLVPCVKTLPIVFGGHLVPHSLISEESVC